MARFTKPDTDWGFLFVSILIVLACALGCMMSGGLETSW